MLEAPGPLRRSKTQRLFLLSASSLQERLAAVVAHASNSSIDQGGGKRRAEETIRQVYLRTQDEVRVLSDCLELEGLE